MKTHYYLDKWDRTHAAARAIARDAWDDRDRRIHPADEADRIARTLSGWSRSRMLEVARSFRDLRRLGAAGLALATMAGVPGCNMIAGVGQDLTAMSRWVQERGANGFKDNDRDDYPTWRDDARALAAEGRR